MQKRDRFPCKTLLLITTVKMWTNSASLLDYFFQLQGDVEICFLGIPLKMIMLLKYGPTFFSMLYLWQYFIQIYSIFLAEITCNKLLVSGQILSY